MFNNKQIKETFKVVNKTAKKVNKNVMATSTEVLSEVIEGSQPWIKLGKKAVKGGVKMAEKQQEIALEAIKEVKGQLKNSQKRFKKIINA